MRQREREGLAIPVAVAREKKNPLFWKNEVVGVMKERRTPLSFFISRRWSKTKIQPCLCGGLYVSANSSRREKIMRETGEIMLYQSIKYS